MLFSISPQPPFQIHHRKQTTFQVINMIQNDIHIRIMPSYGMISPNDRKLISVTNKTSQYDIDVQLEAINYVEDYLEMLEYSNPQLWVEKQPGVLATQTLSIRMNINTDSSSTQQSDKNKLSKKLSDRKICKPKDLSLLLVDSKSKSSIKIVSMAKKAEHQISPIITPALVPYSRMRAEQVPI